MDWTALTCLKIRRIDRVYPSQGQLSAKHLRRALLVPLKTILKEPPADVGQRLQRPWDDDDDDGSEIRVPVF